MRTLIIDDDPKSHRVLKDLLGKYHPDIRVEASAFNLAEGGDLVLMHKPDLVFLDIELPDGLGFELLSRMQDLGQEFHVIFITAYNKYAVTAIRFGALDYLEKPIDREQLSFALTKAREEHQRRMSMEQLQLLLETYEKARNQQLPSRLAISGREEIIYISVNNIIRLQAGEAYTNFVVNGDTKPVLSSINLGKYVEQFKHYREFVQVHRSHMINLNYVVRYIRKDQVVLMANGDRIPVSRRFLDDFRKGMGDY